MKGKPMATQALLTDETQDAKPAKSTAISTRVAAMRADLKARQDTIFAAAAKHVRPERLIEQVAKSCIANSDLLDCTQASLYFSISEAATLGLELDGVLGHAYLVPFRNNRAGTVEAVLVPGYLGLKELAYRSGHVAALTAGIVHDGDKFEYRLGSEPFLNHVPSDNPYTGSPTHAYAIVKTDLGGTIIAVVSWAQFEAHRNKFSKGWRRSDSAYQTNPNAMLLKTVVRKVLKLAPLSSESQAIMQREDYAAGTTIDESAVDPITEEQLAKMRLRISHIPPGDFNEAKFLQLAGCDSLETFPAAKYDEAMRLLAEKMAP